MYCCVGVRSSSDAWVTNPMPSRWSMPILDHEQRKILFHLGSDGCRISAHLCLQIPVYQQLLRYREGEKILAVEMCRR